MKMSKMGLNRAYKPPQKDPVDDTDEEDIVGKVIIGQTKTRALWKKMLAQKKKLMPKAPLDQNAKLTRKNILKLLN